MLFTILFMYVCVLAMLPLTAYCLHEMHAGDQMRAAAAARVAEATADVDRQG